MNYRRLGRTGVKVSPLCLGAMMLGEWGNTDRHECIRIVHAALDHGINFIDTADVYGAGTSEEIVGEAIRGRRDKIVLATKAHLPMGDDINQQGNSRRWLYTALENSLRRLGVDHVDLFQLHRLDPDTDLEETLSALTDLRQMGKVRYFGTSTFPAHELVRAQWVSERNHLGRFSTEQPPYSIIARGIEGDVLPVAQRYDLGVMTWSPLAGGWLSGAYRKDADLPRSYRSDRMPWRFDMSMPDNQRKLEIVESLSLLAESNGMSLPHMALAFAMEHPGVTSAIIGPRTWQHLDSQIGTLDTSLSSAVLDEIDAIVAPGTNVARADGGFMPLSLRDKRLRRR